MKVRCNRDSLLSAFQMASSVVPARSPKPILQNVKFSATSSESLIMATDLEVGVRCQIEKVDVDQGGEAILPTQRVISILRALSDDEVELSNDGSQTQLAGKQSRFELLSDDPGLFPEIPVFEEKKTFHVIASRLMRELIRRTVLATDVENTRYALGGVLLELSDNQIRLVGTDGRRLALAEGPAEGKGGHKTNESPHVVPTKAMRLLERVLHNDDSEIALHMKANEMLLRTQRATVYSRLVEGRFPKYQDVIPKEANRTVEFLADPMLKAVKQAAIVTSDESRGVKFHFESGQLVLTAKTAEVGQSQVTLPLSYEDDAVQISFDPRYISDFLGVLDPETSVTAAFSGDNAASLWKTADGYSYVIMPLTTEQ